MLRFLCRQATFILIGIPFSIGNRPLQIDPENYVPFLYDVQDYYKSSGIFLLYDDYSEIFMTHINIAAFLKQLSSRNILCQTMRYSTIKRKSDFDLARNVQSLFVVFLTSRANYDHFREATEDHDMSVHTWLVVFAEFISDEINEMCLNPVGNPFSLVFNSRMIVQCYGDAWIKKWYSLHENRTEVLELAKWSRRLGISYKNKNYYESRFDMSGKAIRIATVTNMTSTMNGKMTGFFQNVLEELRNYMNFQVVRVKETDAYGRWNRETGEWSGMIGLLTKRQVDIVVAAITVSKFRMDYVDYTIPMITSANRIYIKQPDGARVQWSAYFKAFTVASWSFIALILITASLITAFIRVIVSESKFMQISYSNYFLENFIRIWGIYCQQGVPAFPKATPLRMAYFTMLLLTLVIWAIYSASITSYLTFLSPSLPFSDTDGFVKDGTYRLIVLQNSSDQDLILSGTDPVLSSLQPFLKNLDDLPTNPYFGFQQVCTEKVGFYTSEAYLKGVSAYIPCTLTYIETGQFEVLTMALAKRSPYITSFNYNLRKLEDSGVIQKLHNWYFRRLDYAPESVHSPIGIWGIAPLLSIFACGLALSCLLLCLEHLSNFNRRINRNNRSFRR